MKFKFTDTHAQVRSCKVVLLQYNCEHRGAAESVRSESQGRDRSAVSSVDLHQTSFGSCDGRPCGFELHVPQQAEASVHAALIESQCQQVVQNLTILMRQNTTFHKINRKNLQWLHSKGSTPASDLDKNLLHLTIISTVFDIHNHVCGKELFFLKGKNTLEC